MITNGALGTLAKRIYEFNVTMGWHSGPPDLAKYLMNLHSEVSELWEAWRANKVRDQHGASGIDVGDLCDKAVKMHAMDLPMLTCIEEELADILIRTLDTAHAFGVDIDRAVETKMKYNATRAHRHGGKLA